MSCINIYHPDYIKLLSEIDDSINPFELPTLIRLYQKMNNTDKIPSVSEIYEIDNRTKSQERVSQIQDIQGFKDFVQGKQFQKLTAEEKAKTIEQVTKEQNNSLFGLNTQNQEQLEFHVNTLNVISKFLENAGIETRLIPEFLSQDGSVVEGAIAAANFIEGTVDIIDDLDKGRAEAWNKLPEEASHWWYRLLDKNSELKDALLTSALTDRKEEELRNSLYGETYKDGPKVIGKLALDSNGNITSKPALSAIREEAIGQLIAEAIKRIETKNANASDYSFFKKFLEWINSIIDTFKNTTQDPFEVAAMKILSSDMSDLMTWEEYRKLNNIVNFADVVTEQSVAPLDYTLLEDIGRPSIQYSTGKHTLFKEGGIPVKDVPLFDTREELDNWVYKTYGEEYDKRQKQILQEVRDNQIFFDRLLNKTFRKKSKFLPKTLRKYFDIIDAQNLNPLREWNISQELQQITKKLSEQEKKQIIETNGYTNIAPTLKVLPDLLKKYKKNPIVLSEPIKIDGAKKQELSILNGIREMIKLENPNLKSITAEEFVNEVHNWLQTNYLLGFANEQSYLSYRTDQTFSYLSDRQSDEDVDITNLTEEEIQRLPFEERQRIANIVGLTKQNPDVYHNKVSLRFNDMYHLKSGHFDKSPSAWGNLTYFYTGKNKWKDAVLLHEIQNDNIEFLREFKAEKVDLETSLGRYLQQLNADVLDNITQIESGGKKIIKRDSSEEFRKTHLQLNYQLLQLKDLPLEQGLLQLKQNLNEQIELYKSDNFKNPEKAQEAVDKAYSQRRIFQNFQKRGGIKSLLTKEELQDLENLLKRLNTEEVVGEAQWLHEENQYEPGFPSIRNLKQKKQDFKFKTIELQARITRELQKMYGDNAPLINLTAPAKPLPKSQRNMRTVDFGANQRRIGGASQELNENVNFLIAYSEKQISTQLSKDIEESKKSYIYARNATAANNFNVALSKITPEQYATLIENYKYNEDLLNRLIDEQAQKDVQKESVNISKLTDEEILKDIEGEFEEPNEIDGTAGSGFRYKNMYLSQNANTKEKAIQEIRDRYDSSKQIEKEKQKFETLKQQALDKKAELEKDYGKIEEEVKQTLEIEMNYFTPLVHHLIQKHINQYGKDFPMYFSGYQITRLTQGNDRTAWIYAGKDEIDLIPHSDININGKNYRHDGNMKYVPLAFYIDNKQYRNINGEFSTREDGIIENITEQEYNKAKQEYEKAYQQATERKAKEIKVQAAQELGLFPTASVEKLSDEKLNEGIKALNEFKKIPKSDPRSKYNYKSNADVVIEKLLEINNNKPIETGAIYNAMSQVSGIKLIWQDKIEGLQDNTGGYLVDLSNYNYNVPILYGLQNNKTQERISQIQDIFNENPELTSISTPEQYSQYLDTILPDSKVEEIDNSLYISVLNQLEQENIIEKDCTGGGKLKAKKGLQTNFTKGGKWKIYEIFEGKSHKQGGIDISIKNNQISFTNKNGSIKAKYGLVISKPVMEDYAKDGSLFPNGEEVEVEQDGKKVKYNTSSQEYRDLYNSGKLTTYDKTTDTYSATPLKEVTATAEAPQWLKYKREYEKTNPKSNYINSYLTPFTKSLGNTETNYPKRLDEEYEQKALDYVSEQLVKNKPQGKLSRVEWLNQMSNKEEEIIKRNPKYQSSLWADTKRGLTSLVEQNPLQTFQNIINSSDYTNREKQEMLKDYAQHPVMSKLGDVAKILNPLTIPSKMVQSTYKDDYSFTDALKGKKNNAGIVEDIVTDPLNLIGAGLVGKLSKADKVIDATKVGNKVLSKIEDVLKNISSTERKNMEIVKKGNAYFKELDDPESLKRLKEFGDEYDIDLLDAYKKAEQRWDYGINIGKNDRFQVKKTDEGWYGLSTGKWDYGDELKLLNLKQQFGEDSKQVKDFYKKLSQEKSINYISDVVPLDRYEKTIWHELSHDINKSIIDSSPKLQEDIKNIFIEKGAADINKVKKAREYVAEDFYTKKDEILKGLDDPKKLNKISEEEFDYVTRPTETWAFLSTNLRQDLKNTGVIKNYNELLTPEKLEQAIKNGNTVFSRFEPYIKDKEAFIKLFNKMTLSIAPAALYFQSQNPNKSEQ